MYSAQRPSARQLLRHKEEILLLLSLLLENNSLQQKNASFSESLYSLRRIPLHLNINSGLSMRQRLTSLTFLALIPYIRAKLDALSSDSSDTAEADEAGEQGQVLKAVLRVYPYVAAIHEGIRFLYQLLFLVGKSQYYSPELHAAGLRVVRVSGNELAAISASTAATRAQKLQRLTSGGGGWISSLSSLLQRTVLRIGYAVNDNIHSTLILVVFGYKLLEWWYTSGEQRLGGTGPVPPPPPPPPPPVSPIGIKLPEDRSLCPLCTRHRVNPAIVASSGYVFCYACVYRFIEANGACPVTRIKARVEDIRRLYHGS